MDEDLLPCEVEITLVDDCTIRCCQAQGHEGCHEYWGAALNGLRFHVIWDGIFDAVAQT